MGGFSEVAVAIRAFTLKIPSGVNECYGDLSTVNCAPHATFASVGLSTSSDPRVLGASVARKLVGELQLQIVRPFI